ncbi:MAG: type II toxin-antitoxin system RelB/DinJ family antitoxin [Coriobacteriales bacterium]|jgi:DNA-damage-inducible protein J|nr:type II toxin-antitoxin system RelB/DinJ family antitoxin [Coriobacteriales bacterium]
MPTSTFNIRMDADLKKGVDDVSKSIGLTSAAAFNVFARQFVAHRGFPFAVLAPVPTEDEFAKEMDRVYLSMRDGDVVEHELIED